MVSDCWPLGREREREKRERSGCGGGRERECWADESMRGWDGGAGLLCFLLFPSAIASKMIFLIFNFNILIFIIIN